MPPVRVTSSSFRSEGRSKGVSADTFHSAAAVVSMMLALDRMPECQAACLRCVTDGEADFFALMPNGDACLFCLLANPMGGGARGRTRLFGIVRKAAVVGIGT